MNKMEVEKCVVCLETFDNASSKKKTVCEHEFHGECLEKWVKQEGTCPVCRRVLRKKSWVLKKAQRWFFFFFLSLLSFFFQVMVGVVILSLICSAQYLFFSKKQVVEYSAVSDFCFESESASFCFLKERICKSQVAIKIGTPDGNSTLCLPDLILNLF